MKIISNLIREKEEKIKIVTNIPDNINSSNKTNIKAANNNYLQTIQAQQINNYINNHRTTKQHRKK